MTCDDGEEEEKEEEEEQQEQEEQGQEQEQELEEGRRCVTSVGHVSVSVFQSVSFQFVVDSTRYSRDFATSRVALRYFTLQT